MKWSIIFILILAIPFVYSEECDWEVKILSDTIFKYDSNFEFRYYINKISGNKTVVILNRTIEDAYGTTVKEYGKYSEEITRYHTTPPLFPNLKPETYLIKGNIFPDCNDSNLENNLAEKLIVILPEPLSQDYSLIKITEFLPDPIGADADSEWIELFNSGEYALNLENSSIYDNIGVDADIFIADSNTLNNTIIYPKEFLVVYTIGRDSLLNNDGFEKIRLYKDDYLIDEVSYSGSKEGLSWSKVDSRWILTYPTPNEPNEIESPKNSSHLEIETVYLGSDNKSKFGDQIRVRINVYKGDTTKYNLDMYIKDKEQVSKRSEINLYESFKNYVLTIPIQIEPNCNQKYPDGTYTIYLTGLDKTATEEIEIEGINGDLCKVITETVTVSSVSQKESSNDDFFSTENQEVIEDNEITGEVAYTSSDVKSKNTGIYFFAGALLIVIIYLIVKKTL